jgi:hypothetical protein
MKRLEIDFLECTPTSLKIEFEGYRVSTKRYSTVISKNNKCLALLRLGTEETPIEDYLHTIKTFFTNNK